MLRGMQLCICWCVCLPRFCLIWRPVWQLERQSFRGSWRQRSDQHSSCQTPAVSPAVAAVCLLSVETNRRWRSSWMTSLRPSASTAGSSWLGWHVGVNCVQIFTLHEHLFPVLWWSLLFFFCWYLKGKTQKMTNSKPSYFRKCLVCWCPVLVIFN